eukprot:jgi/Chrzof1/1580/Cz10g13080.t1
MTSQQHTSWRYTVNIPLWILGKDAEGESVALYRVNVLLQSPDAPDLSMSRPPFFVLRRYSQFRQLHAELKNQFPELMKERNMQPPPKNAFQLGNQKELLDKRREELEKWMWRLISKPEVARSTVLKAFLDFEKALQRAQQQRLPVNTSPGGTPLSSATSSYVASRNGNGPTSNASSDAGDFDDARSEMSANSSIPSTSTPMTDMGMAPGFDAMRSAAGTPEVSTSPSIMRLGLRLEQRADIRRLVEVLSRRVRQAGDDLAAAVNEIQQLQVNNSSLVAQLSTMQDQLQGNEPLLNQQLQRRLAAEQEETVRLRRQLSDADVAQREFMDLQEQLAEAERSRAAATHQLHDMQESLRQKEQQLLEQVQELRSSAESRERELSSQLEAALAQQQQQGADTTVTDLMQQIQQLQAELQSAQVQHEQLLGETGVLQQQLQQQQTASAAAAGKSRADHVVLAKEIKRLRVELAETQKVCATTCKVSEYSYSVVTDSMLQHLNRTRPSF